MNKLKTLKDFEVNPKSWAGAMANAGRKYTIDIPELRQEAIKHIKDKQDTLLHNRFLTQIEDIAFVQGGISSLKEVFNITEEDLKDE